MACIVLKEVGENKVKVIKIVHEATGLGLKEAKEAVDAVENGISYKMIIISGNDKKIFEELLAVGAVISWNDTDGQAKNPNEENTGKDEQRKKMINYFEVLNISEDAEIEVIKAAYKALAKKYHPDNTDLSPEEALKRMTLINEAFDVLSNEISRNEHIQKLHRQNESRMQGVYKENAENEVQIFGKTLELDNDRMLDIVIHREVKRIADETVNDVKGFFAKHKTIEEVMRDKDVFSVLFALIYYKCDEFLEKLGITEIEGSDIQNLRHKHPTNYFYDSFDKLENEYKRILIHEENNKESKLRKLYNDSSMRRELEQAAYMDVYDLIPIIQYLLQKEGIGNNPITLKDEEEGVNLFKYLKGNKLDKEKAYKVAYQLFSTDPTEPEYYDWCIVHFPEEIANLVKLERLVGYEPAKSILEKGLQALFEKMPHDTEDETLQIKEKLENIRIAVGISDSSTIKKVDKMLVQFDIEARTFQNIEFATRDLRKKAEIDYLELSKFCEGVEKFDENNCTEHRVAIENKDYVQEIANIFLQKIEDRKITIWKEEDAVKIESVFLNTNINDVESIRNSVSEIERIGRTDDKENYIDALNGMSSENKQLFIKYHEWKDKKFLEKYLLLVILWIIGGIGMMVGIGLLILLAALIVTIFKVMEKNKMKRAWELLSVEGRLVHPQLLEAVKVATNN